MEKSKKKCHKGEQDEFKKKNASHCIYKIKSVFSRTISFSLETVFRGRNMFISTTQSKNYEWNPFIIPQNICFKTIRASIFKMRNTVMVL